MVALPPNNVATPNSQTLPPPALSAAPPTRPVAPEASPPPPASGSAPPNLGAYANKLFELAAQAEAHVKQTRESALLPSVMSYAQTELLEPDKVARQFREMASRPAADKGGE